MVSTCVNCFETLHLMFESSIHDTRYECVVGKGVIGFGWRYFFQVFCNLPCDVGGVCFARCTWGVLSRLLW